MPQYLALAMAFWLATGCGKAEPEELSVAHRRALADSVVSLFDSLTAIHRDRPDTGLLRRLHPPADTVLFIEGMLTEAFVGESLFRRVVAAHVPVRSMKQRFSDRTAHLLDSRHALITAREAVEWVDAAGPHHYSGLLTLAISRHRKRSCRPEPARDGPLISYALRVRPQLIREPLGGRSSPSMREIVLEAAAGALPGGLSA